MFVVRLFSLLVFSTALIGCVSSARIAAQERSAYSTTTGNETIFLDTVTANSTYALNLAHLYISEASQTSKGQDALALGYIGAAAVGASVIAFDGPRDILRGVGLAVGTATATSNYLKPGEVSNALLIAAERMICISEAARIATKRYVSDDADTDVDVVEILQAGIRNVRINLRKSLTRSPPDYGTLLNQITASAGIVAQSGGNEEVQAKLNEISQAITKCATLNI